LICATSDQEGLRHIDESVLDNDLRESGQERLPPLLQMGVSNVFLVRCRDLSTAMTTTGQVLTRGNSLVKPISSSKDSKSDEVWMVAYLGLDAQGSVYRVESVAVSGRTIRASYRYRHPAVSNSGLQPYFYWVPLGRVAPGTYRLELYDADQEEVTLMRRVRVN
jgi:hypothetical protein